MYIQAVELWIKSWIPALWFPALIVCIVGGGIFGLIYAGFHEETTPTNYDEAWSTTLSIAAPIMVDDESGEEYVDWNQCIMVTETGAACMHPVRPYHLPDKHDWIPETRYQCVDLAQSGHAHGDDWSLLDHMIFSLIPPEGCRWSCDPATEEFCQE
ncbi:hypothetical protein KJ910_00720 [Patescibacteria group bacterium]|nr:hypothetical protein [Patescibacteria group bacterium]MBU1907196.1 hypothetical protein [Patescibacteria group bacterium]